MEQSDQKRIQISNELLDNMLVGVKTQDDLWGKNGIITQLNKANMRERNSWLRY